MGLFVCELAAVIGLLSSRPSPPGPAQSVSRIRTSWDISRVGKVGFIYFTQESHVAFKCLSIQFSVADLVAWLEAFKCLNQSLHWNYEVTGQNICVMEGRTKSVTIYPLKLSGDTSH